MKLFSKLALTVLAIPVILTAQKSEAARFGIVAELNYSMPDINLVDSAIGYGLGLSLETALASTASLEIQALYQIYNVKLASNTYQNKGLEIPAFLNVMLTSSVALQAGGYYTLGLEDGAADKLYGATGGLRIIFNPKVSADIRYNRDLSDSNFHGVSFYLSSKF